MKTALDLPDDLMREIRIEAATRGKKLKDLIADLLRAGLDAPRNQKRSEAILTTDPLTGLPVVGGTHSARPTNEMTPARISEILLLQEEQWHFEAR